MHYQRFYKVKRRIIYIIILTVLFTIVYLNAYYKLEYNISLFDQFQNSSKLTNEEKEWLQSRESLIFGSDQLSPPLRYVDMESKQYKGLVVDYVRLLSVELKTKIKFKPMAWHTALETLAKGETDFADMFPSPERAKVYNFTKPIYFLRGVILIPIENNDIANYSDLAEKKVAVPKGDYAVEFLNNGVDGIEFNLTSDIQHAIQLLNEKKVDAVVGDEPVIIYFMDKMKVNRKYKIPKEPMYEKDVVFGVPKSKQLLLSIFNKAILSLDKRMAMSKIHQKWFGISTLLTKENRTEKYWLIVVVFLTAFSLVFYLLYSWNTLLKKEVNRRTEELNISRNDLQITFNGLTHLMIVLNKDLQILNINKAFTSFQKKSRQEILGSHFYMYAIFQNWDKDDCIVKKTLQDGNTRRMEFRFESRIYEINTFPLRDNNQQVQKVLVMVKDVTEVKISERELLFANKMSAIGQLATGVAHEIKNPLGLIRNYNYILKKDKSKNLDKCNEAHNAIDLAVEKASKTINNLLNFTSISDNRYETVKMRDLLNNILSLEYKIMNRNNITHEITCDNGLECILNVDSLRHILLNIISNAVDAMPDGGHLYLSCILSTNILEIICKDTGIGIKPEHLEDIFNPFFTTKSRDSGTGLGLYIVYNEIKKLDGEIEVKSESGKGTSFKMQIPLREEMI